MGIYVAGSLGDDVRCVSTGEPLANITMTSSLRTSTATAWPTGRRLT